MLRNILLILSPRFRWVFCQLETLRYCLPPSVKRILEELPETLDETYERILLEIPKSNRVHAHRLLQCLTVAARPLRVEELAEVLAVDFGATGGIPRLKEDLRWEDQEQAVLSACSSLIAIIEDGWSRVVQFSHFSVKEFLTSDLDGSRYHHILLQPANTIMAQACLGVLLRFDYDIDEKIRSFSLAEYAAEHFGDHVEFENVLPHIHDGVDYLLDADKPHLAAWFWMRDGRDGLPQQLTNIPLFYVTGLGHLSLVQHLISRRPEDVNVLSKDGTPLHTASRGGHVKTLQLLLRHGVDVDARDIVGQTPLHLAADKEALEIIRMLIECNADINARDNKGQTSLYRVVAPRHGDSGLNAASFLLGHGADPDSRDDDLLTPLHAAAFGGSDKTAQLLLEHGANIHARNKDGQTPLHWTLVGADDGVVEWVFNAVRFLLEHGAGVDELDNDHSTPLHVAAYYGSIRAAQILLEHGANVHLQNKEGMTPSQVASTKGHEEFTRLLSGYLDSE